MRDWVEVECMVCDHVFAVDRSVLAEDGCHVDSDGAPADLHCPYCDSVAVFAGEPVEDEVHDVVYDFEDED